jgi:hypothetical protein
MRIITSAESAIQFHNWFSIPGITLIEINAMPAQQLAVFLLKGASAMVFLLRLYILQHSIELARTYRKRRISALPEKAAIPRIKRFDPFRGHLLYLLDHLSLRNGSWQRRDNLNVVSRAADVDEVGTEVAADCRQITMHARPRICIEPGLAILRAKDDVQDDFTK